MSAPAPSPDSRRLQTARCSCGGEERRDSGAGAIRRACGRQPLGRSPRVVGAVGAKLDEQERASVGQQAHCVESLGAREVRQMMVEALERLRAMLQNPRHLVGGEVNIVEAEHHQREASRTGHQPQRRRERDPERPFRADQRARQVAPALRQKLVEVVAGDAARNFRITPPNLISRALYERARRGINLALAAAARRQRRRLALAACTERQPRAVVERDFQRLDVVDSLAVSGGVSAARIVADHPADRAAVLGRRIGREEQAVAGSTAALSWACTTPGSTTARPRSASIRRIEFMYLEKSSTIAALQAWPASAVPPPRDKNRKAVLARQPERAHHVALVARNHDPQRDLPVDRGVGGIERERGVVGAHLAVDGAAEFIP